MAKTISGAEALSTPQDSRGGGGWLLWAIAAPVVLTVGGLAAMYPADFGLDQMVSGIRGSVE